MVSLVFLAFLSLARFANVALASLACPDNNGQTFIDPVSKSTYVIECGVDRPGADLPGNPGWTNNLEACIALCSSTPQCVEAVYIPGSPGPCYLKSGLNPPSLDGKFMAAHLLSAEGPRCPDSDHLCLNVLDKGTCYSTECDSDRAGNILLQVIATTFQDCLDHCEAKYLDGCSYVSFLPGLGTISPGGTCTLRSTYSQSKTSAPGSWGAIRQSICPNQNGANVTTSPGKKYHLECGIDRYGGDMAPPVWTDGVYSCMIACNNLPGCVAVNWHFGYPTGPCYLKSSVNPSTSNPAVNGAYWVPDCVSGASTVSTTVYTSTSVHTTFPWVSTHYTPLYLYNLQRLSSPVTPLTYDATPSPSTVPGGPQCYGWVGPGCTGTAKRDAMPEPTASQDAPIEARDVPSFCTPSTTVTKTVSTYLSTQTTLTSTCTYFAAALSTNVPAYCQPTFAFNLPSPPSDLAAAPSNNVAIAPSITARNKLDCCAACTRIFNCVWWKFDFGVSTPHDPWSPGTCTFAYFTGVNRVDDGNTPAVCPNGIYPGSSWFVAGFPYSTSAYYGTGYNPGACGGGLNLFESNTDQGLPPDYYSRLCPGQNFKKLRFRT